MYLQSNVIDLERTNSIKLKMTDRLRNLAIKKDIDAGSDFSLVDLLKILCDVGALSPTEFRAIGYILDICDKAADGSKVDPYKLMEASAIGERVIHIIDNRLDTA